MGKFWAHAVLRRKRGQLQLALCAFASFLLQSAIAQTNSPRQPILDSSRQLASEEKDEAPGDLSTGLLYVDGYLVWVYAQPKRTVTPIGSLRAGQTAQSKYLNERGDAQIVSTQGCKGGWFAIQPAGFVCKDRFISLKSTRYFRSMQKLLPQAGPYPFDYALSMGSPAYRRIPSQSELDKSARFYGRPKARPMPRHWRGHEELVFDLALGLTYAGHLPATGLFLGPVPSFLENEGSAVRQAEKRLKRREVPFGSMLALNSAFRVPQGEMLQSADGTVVPRSRFRLFKRSNFQGLELTEEIKLPLAWPKNEVNAYELTPNARQKIEPVQAGKSRFGRLEKAKLSRAGKLLSPLEKRLPARTPLQLTGRRLQADNIEFLEMKGGHWVPRAQVYLAEYKPSSKALAQANKKWIHFSITRGTLTSYVGEEAVFTTLASPGIGGRPKIGQSPLESRTTPVGTFRINYKYYSDDMSPEAGEHRKFWIAEVPFTQYFQQPFAIHVAYWHQSFGEPMSGGCINVSPRDGQRLTLLSQRCPIIGTE